jgi:hypothetical protein
MRLRRAIKKMPGVHHIIDLPWLAEGQGKLPLSTDTSKVCTSGSTKSAVQRPPRVHVHRFRFRQRQNVIDSRRVRL